MWFWVTLYYKPYKIALFSRTLEEYIRRVEKDRRAQQKQQKKGLLAIDMHDHVNKTTTQGREGTLINVRNKLGLVSYLTSFLLTGDYLKLGDTEVMYEIVSRAYHERSVSYIVFWRSSFM